MSRRSGLWAFVGAGALAAATLVSASPAGAAPNTITLHRDDGASGYTGDVGGGEFGVTQLDGLSVPAMDPAVAVPGSIFQTFCLEGGVHVPMGVPVIYTVSDAAKAGGQSGAVNGEDPISLQTSYLFFNFWHGTLTTPYDNTLGAGRKDSATQLQIAIWYFEGEFDPVFIVPGSDAEAFIDEADAAVNGGSWTDNHGVRVLNLTNSAGDDLQDVLVLTAEDDCGLRLTKTASPNPAAAFEPVTFRYDVENTGGKVLTNVTIVDDAGTPSDTSDDFTVASGVTLQPGEVASYFSDPVILPVKFCQDINGVPTEVGTLYVASVDDCWRFKYVQSRNVVDNTYGTGAVGWPKGHSFGNLTGSDKAEFRLKDADGAVVLDFFLDYITSSSAFPSGFGTLGFTGGDGKLVSGDASNIKSYATSMSDTINLPLFQSGYTVNSPLPELANPTWDYDDSYTVLVKKSAFGAGGFGSVEIPAIHNSPSKYGFNLFTPTPCENVVTNIATATADCTRNGVTTLISTTGTTTVVVGPSSGGADGCDLVALSPKFKDRTMSLTLTNTGSDVCTITRLQLTWPSSNKKLKKIKVNGKEVFKTARAPTSTEVTTWVGSASLRQIAPGASKTVTFEFESKASTSASGYGLFIDHGTGYSGDFIP
jgi:hypothetical protein